MHCEQSRVGNVSESCAIRPPIEGVRSTRRTSNPASAISSAAWIPLIPPPMTRHLAAWPTSIGDRGWFPFTFSTIARAMRIALSVVSGPSWTHEHPSRMFAISRRYGLSPASSAARRNVVSCIEGEQAATTTPVRRWSPIAFLIMSWPGSEHMYSWRAA